MAHALFVAVIYRFQNLPEHMCCILLREVLLLNDSLEELPSVADPAVRIARAYSITR